MDLIDQSKEKIILVTLSALVAFVGLEILQLIMGAYVIPVFIWVSAVVYFALFFLQVFVFDLHIKRATSYESLAKNLLHSFKRRFRYMIQIKHLTHFLNYLLLPGILYWSTVVMIFINPFNDSIKQVWIVLSSVALVANFWYMKTVFYNHKSASYLVRQHIFIVKLYASYLAYTSALGLFHYYGFDVGFFGIAVFCLTYLLVYQALFQHHNVKLETIKFIVFISILLALTGVAVYLFWNVNYFSGALVMTAIYSTSWGLIHHKFMDKDLTKTILYEYLAILFFVLVVLFSITNFSERI